MGKDYYAILGIPKDADEDAIKKAYRKLALKWHPDRNPDSKELADKKFKELAEAYEVLIDKNKRQIYDQFGEEGLKNSGGPPPGAGGRGFPQGFSFGGGGFRPHSADFIFEQFFGGGFGGGSSFMDVDDDFGGSPFGFGGGRSSKPKKAPAVQKHIQVSLEELYTGASKKMKVTRKVFDATGRPSTLEKILQIDIKPGWKSGTKVRFEGEGDEISPGNAQAIEFVIEEKPHPVFKREGHDLHMNITLSLSEALTGFTKPITTVDGRTANISNVNVTQPGQTMTYANAGMPNQKNPNQKGNLVIHFNVQFPSSLTDIQKDTIRKVLA
ncbi:DnaJ-domain-containing protein [Rozella allomycis CSF55]|uniref:Chaperone DnaJ domain-containing protein n=1 Tax=Rozella allomycis (strain CSF55) TaxID=988480 RepID=A0A075B3N5_ROZAC|nr:Chaperone DnaJ domain-containing protein [Rozella allomycis CSF55]RKP19787.1 DnaJ-domain-containing protein [Rozella allomycis CSF55]|eukprot:EPZ35621.1 Chaperone DnaJ domain-containing protein [Rozella allomycis CSF55]